uniref:N-acetylglucosamine-1-phosphotransferase subunits alpha/beta-like n=2 Tax=Hirondellea gigas TaxID=1518452 RepID=A0A6A7G249_9CRUS
MQLCNVASCGFDCGDCGASNVKQQLTALPTPVLNSTVHAILQHDVVAWWIDLSSVLSDDYSIEGYYNVSNVDSSGSGVVSAPGDKTATAASIRPDSEEHSHKEVHSLTVSAALEAVVAVVQEGFVSTIHLYMKLTHKQTHHVAWLNYSISYNTSIPATLPAQDSTNSAQIIQLSFNFTQLGPRQVPGHESSDETRLLAETVGHRAYYTVNENASSFDPSTIGALHIWTQAYLHGEITLKGLKIKRTLLIKQYLQKYPNQTQYLVFFNVLSDNLGTKLLSSKGESTTASPVSNSEFLAEQGVNNNRKLLWYRNEDQLHLTNNLPKSNDNYNLNEGLQRVSLNRKSDHNFNSIDSRSVKVKHLNMDTTNIGEMEHFGGNLPWEKRVHSSGRDIFDWDIIAYKLRDKISPEDETVHLNDVNNYKFESPYELRQEGMRVGSKLYRAAMTNEDNFRLSQSNPKNRIVLENHSDMRAEDDSIIKSLKLDRNYPRGRNSEEKEEEILKIAPGRRKLQDFFSSSLLYVNRLYNDELGNRLRKVPAHMPHFIDVAVMEELQNRFQSEFRETSSHRVRESYDMQFAFSYYYYLLGATRNRTEEEIFDMIDTDRSGTWSDRRMRTLLSRVGDTPVHYDKIQELHKALLNCSQYLNLPPVPTPPYERYADSNLPAVTLELVQKCSEVLLVLAPLRKVARYHTTELSDSVVHFKMITSSITKDVTMLDEVRKEPRKFICLNNNLDPEGSDNTLIMALMQDTYEALFPQPSSFELPANYRNKFLYVSELEAWRRWRDLVRLLVYACFAALFFITVTSFCGTNINSCRRRWFCRSRPTLLLPQ